jgi:hypothetical protein
MNLLDGIETVQSHITTIEGEVIQTIGLEGFLEYLLDRPDDLSWVWVDTPNTFYGLEIPQSFPLEELTPENLNPIVAQWLADNELPVEALATLDEVSGGIFTISNDEIPFVNPNPYETWSDVIARVEAEDGTLSE